MTTGVAFWASEVNLSDGTVANRVWEQHQQWIEKQLAAMAKKQEAEAELRQKVDHAWAKGLCPENRSINDLWAKVSWFKQPGDCKIPSNWDSLVEHYLLTCNHCEVKRSHLKEGEQPGVDEGQWDGWGNDENCDCEGSCYVLTVAGWEVSMPCVVQVKIVEFFDACFWGDISKP